MKNKLIVLSMDAMVGEDLEYLKTKPNFSKLMGNYAWAGKAETIYPSITYPAHVSMATGCRPGKTGVYANTRWKTEPAKFVDWYYDSDIIKTEDIFEAAKKAGCTTASVYWPVTGRNKNIDFLINEYFFPFPEEDVEEGFKKFGANEKTLEVVRKNLNRYPTKFRERKAGKKLTLDQTFDDFINGCMCSMITDIQPDLLLVHNCIMDTWRHRYGLFHPYTYEALDQADLWFGEILNAIESVGNPEDYNFVIVSDHGQMDFARRLKFNVLLKRGGFIDVDTEGKVSGWKAFSQSNGMSVSVYLHDKNDKETEKKLYNYLNDLLQQGVWGFSKIWTTDEVKEKYGVWGDFTFMIETDGITAFADGWNEPIVNPINLEDYRLGMATHGYQPEKGPQPIFVANGPAFKKGAYITEMKTIDEAPTFAHILGGNMKEAEGRVITELLV